MILQVFPAARLLQKSPALRQAGLLYMPVVMILRVHVLIKSATCDRDGYNPCHA
jgi:hypothetical protein